MLPEKSVRIVARHHKEERVIQLATLTWPLLRQKSEVSTESASTPARANPAAFLTTTNGAAAEYSTSHSSIPRRRGCSVLAAKALAGSPPTEGGVVVRMRGPNQRRKPGIKCRRGLFWTRRLPS